MDRMMDDGRQTRVRQLILSFLASLNVHGRKYCVTRNYEDIGGHTNEDLDILTRSTEFPKIQRVFHRVAHEHGFYVYSTRLYGRSLTIKAVFKDSISPLAERPVVLEVHLVAYISLYLSDRQRRMRGLATRVFWDQISTRTYHSGGVDIVVPDLAWEFLVLLSRLEFKPKKKYLERCMEFLKAADTCAAIGITPDDCADMLNAISKGHVDRRYRAAMQTVYDALCSRRPLSPVFQCCYLAMLHVTSLFRRKGIIVSFSGPDGSGKTSNMTRVVEVLSDSLKCQVIGVKYLYPVTNRLRPIARGLHSGIRMIDPKDAVTFERDRGSGFNWTLRRLLGLIAIIVQYPWGYLWARFMNMCGRTVVVETSILDAFVKGHRPEFRTLQRLTVPFLPRSDLYFLMKASPTSILERKPELTRSEIQEYYRRMDSLLTASQSVLYTVASDGDMTVAVGTILQSILARLDGVCPVPANAS